MRQNQTRVTVSVDGVSLGVFEDRTGGETDSQETLYQLGGMGPRVSLGGNQQVGNVTVRALFDAARRARTKWLLGRAGKGRVVVTEQVLDQDGNAIEDPYVWSGTLKKVSIPDAAADADAAAQLELEVSVAGQVA